MTLIDPEGYVFTKTGYGKARIAEATVSLGYLPSDIDSFKNTSLYELWPAKNYQQENPQITDDTGRYAFLVPQGWYYLQVEADGYKTYFGKPFEGSFGKGIHNNIEVKKENIVEKLFRFIMNI